MSLRVAVQMDPVLGINIDTDTTFQMMMEAQARGHRLWVYTPDKLSMEDGRVFARAQSLVLTATQGAHAELGDSVLIDMKDDIDVVLMRQDPPFDMAYITATHFLEKIHPHTLVVNNPAEVRNAPEKLFVTDFPGVQPPTRRLERTCPAAGTRLIAPTGSPSTSSTRLSPLLTAGTNFWAMTCSRPIMACSSSRASRLGSSASSRATPEPPPP